MLNKEECASEYTKIGLYCVKVLSDKIHLLVFLHADIDNTFLLFHLRYCCKMGTKLYTGDSGLMFSFIHLDLQFTFWSYCDSRLRATASTSLGIVNFTVMTKLRHPSGLKDSGLSDSESVLIWKIFVPSECMDTTSALWQICPLLIPPAPKYFPA